jgi:hypothetical protein
MMSISSITEGCVSLIGTLLHPTCRPATPEWQPERNMN